MRCDVTDFWLVTLSRKSSVWVELHVMFLLFALTPKSHFPSRLSQMVSFKLLFFRPKRPKSRVSQKQKQTWFCNYRKVFIGTKTKWSVQQNFWCFFSLEPHQSSHNLLALSYECLKGHNPKIQTQWTKLTNYKQRRQLAFNIYNTDKIR